MYDCTCDPRYYCSIPAIQDCKYVGPGCGCCDDDDCNIVVRDLWGKWADGCPKNCGPCIMRATQCEKTNPLETDCIGRCRDVSDWENVPSYVP